MKNFLSIFIALVIIILLIMSVIIILLLIDLISINDAIYYYSYTYYSLYPSDLNTFHVNYGYKNSIFNPILDLFYKNNYYPSYFIKREIKSNYSYPNSSLIEIIPHKQYYIIDNSYNNYYDNNIKELLKDLGEIVKEYKMICSLQTNI